MKSRSWFYGMVKAGGVSVGYQALFLDSGIAMEARVWRGSSATMGICGRQGLGCLRHIETQCLWIQQRVRDKSLELYTVRGEDNPADFFTKHLSSPDRIDSLLKLFGCSHRGGRSDLAPKLRKETGTSNGEKLFNVAGQPLHGWNASMIEWEQWRFPTTDLDGERVPEAFPMTRTAAGELTCLQHPMSELQACFPKVVACEELEDSEPLEDDGLELREATLGACQGRAGRRPCPSSAKLPTATTTNTTTQRQPRTTTTTPATHVSSTQRTHSQL
jgi:hypothetical protein